MKFSDPALSRRLERAEGCACVQFAEARRRLYPDCGAEQQAVRFVAFEHGCDLAMMAAEVGTNSQRNAERQGFRIAYTRTKWRLASS